MISFISINLPLNKKMSGQFSKFLKKKIPNFSKAKITKNIYSMNNWGEENPSIRKHNRFNLDDSLGETIVKFQTMEIKKLFFDVCFINRDNLSYCLLYRLTALKLRAEGDKKTKNQIKGIEDFRTKILKNILLIDQPISQGLILAEKRIKEILNKNILKEEIIINKIGEDSTSISCFWIVLHAALNAWEKKGKSDEQNYYETYEKLKKIRQIFSDSKKHQYMLAFELKYIETKFDSKNFSEFEKYESNYVEGLKIIISQLEKLPNNSYGPLLEKIIVILNQVLEKNFSTQMENFENFKITFPLSKIESNSRLIEIQNNGNI